MFTLFKYSIDFLFSFTQTGLSQSAITPLHTQTNYTAHRP